MFRKIYKAFKYLFTHSFVENYALLVWKVHSMRSMIPLPRKKVRYSDKSFGSACAVSVIVPVYNAAEYLTDCLDSIFSQKFRDFEVICVDDGSKDNSLDILTHYQEKHPNMTVLTQKNQYAGVARNHGLSVANGEYVMFVDADDLIRKDTLEKAYAKAKSVDADVVIFGAATFVHKAKKALPISSQLMTEYLPEKDPFSYHDVSDRILNITPGGPCNKLFRREVITQNCLEFPPYRSSNDLGFVLLFLALAKRITTIDEPFYFIRRGMETNLSSTRDKTPMQGLIAYEQLQNNLKKFGVYEDIKTSFINFALSGCIYGISVIKSEELRLEVERKFLEDYQYRFEIADKSEAFFFHKRRWLQYCEMKGRHWDLFTPESAPLVSVVVPMYNCEEYVSSLLDNLMEQTMQDFEIICVDDGSTDDTAAKVKAYQEKNNKITYCYKENGGAGTARNLGLHKAKGTYIMFLDADDIYDPALLEKLTSAAVERDADVVNCRFKRVDFWKNETVENLGYDTKLIPSKKVFSPEEVTHIFNAFTQGPINKLFKRQFLEAKSISFSSTKIANDMKFTMLAHMVANRIVCIEDSLITVRRHVNEKSLSSMRGNYLDHVVIAYRELYDSLVSRHLINQYELLLCRTFGNSLRYNGSYAKSEKLVQKTVEWVRSEPWSKYDREKLFGLLRITDSEIKAKKLELETLKEKHEMCVNAEERARIEVQMVFAENLIANIEAIRENVSKIYTK